MSLQECGICIEKFNKSKKTKVVCEFCEYECCRDCFKTYVLNNNHEAECMNCKKTFSKKMLIETMPKKWVNGEYKKHMENVFFEREKALFPMTQKVVEEEIRKDKIKNRMNDILLQISKLQEEYRSCLSNNTTTTTERAVFTKKCPHEECRGFLSSQWKCGLCEIKVCSECHEIKGFEKEEINKHECKKENIETVELLKKDTKNCPKCTTPIHRIEGCNQMYCIECHTAFDWKTLRIETGIIHNPEYFKYLRNSGRQERNPNDIICGREIDHHFANQKSMIKYINLCRNIIHFRHIELRRFQVDRIADNEKLRVKYLRNLITEDEFKVSLQKKMKDYYKKQEINNILRILLDSITDILYRYNAKEKVDIKSECIVLTEYVNSELESISKVYNSKKYIIDDQFTLN